MKPEISAPGTNIHITSGISTGDAPDPGDVHTGTSYASPTVAGGAAALMEHQTVFKYWPEGVKAVLIATANNNRIKASGSIVDDKAGTGGINLDRADLVANNDGNTGGWGPLYPTCQGFRDHGDIVVNLYANAGEHVRAAIVWDTAGGYSDYYNRPGADLDLHLKDPYGNTLPGSYSWDNTYEISEFVTTNAGQYKLVIHNYRCDYDPGYGAYAWYREPYQSSFATVSYFGATSFSGYLSGSSGPTALSASSEFPGSVDFDGDGRSDIGVWRESTGEWFILTSSSNWNSSLSRQWGALGDILVPAKYTTSNRTDMAVWWPSTGTWHILSASNFNSASSYQWGNSTDVLVPADYDGDGKTDVAVWRPSNGTWYILKSSQAFNAGLAWAVQWGGEGDIPIARDIDGDNRTDFGV